MFNLGSASGIDALIGGVRLDRMVSSQRLTHTALHSHLLSVLWARTQTMFRTPISDLPLVGCLRDRGVLHAALVDQVVTAAVRSISQLIWQMLATCRKHLTRTHSNPIHGFISAQRLVLSCIRMNKIDDGCDAELFIRTDRHRNKAYENKNAKAI